MLLEKKGKSTEHLIRVLQFLPTIPRLGGGMHHHEKAMINNSKIERVTEMGIKKKVFTTIPFRLYLQPSFKIWGVKFEQDKTNVKSNEMLNWGTAKIS